MEKEACGWQASGESANSLSVEKYFHSIESEHVCLMLASK